MALLQAVQALLGSVEEEWEFEPSCCLAVALAVTQAVVSRLIPLVLCVFRDLLGSLLSEFCLSGLGFGVYITMCL